MKWIRWFFRSPCVLRYFPITLQVCRLQQLGTVHDPTLQKEPPRCFESDIPEFFTQTARWVIPVVRSPQAIYFSILAHNQGLSPDASPFTVAGGACLW